MKPFKVLQVEHLTQETYRIRTERPDVPIVAGQCFNVGIPGGGINREYSMYSDANGPYVDFLVKLVEGGSLTPALQRLRGWGWRRRRRQRRAESVAPPRPPTRPVPAPR